MTEDGVQIRSARLVALVAACALLTACAQDRTLTLEAAPKDLFDRSARVTVSGSYTVADRHGRVVAGAADGMGTGMGQGALGSVAGGASTGNVVGLALGILLMPVFAIGGGIYGAAAAHPAEETRAASQAMERVYNDDRLLGGIEDLIRERVVALGFPEQLECDEGKTGTVNRDAASSEKGGAIIPQ